MNSTTGDGFSAFSPSAIIHFFRTHAFPLASSASMRLLNLNADISIEMVTLGKFHSTHEKAALLSIREECRRRVATRIHPSPPPFAR